jgi:MFS transporter, DHA1 family, tetracycline resistance protein
MSPTQPADDRLDFKRVLPIFVIVFVDLLGLTIILPLLPIYASAFGANPVVIGIIGATYPTMQLLASPILGNLSDRFGRKPVLIFSQIGTFCGFILLGFANAVPLVILSRMIDGISGANTVTARAAITDSTTERTRAQGLGLIGAAFGLGFVIGPAIAGVSLALTGNDYRIPAFMAAGCSLVSIILTSVWFKETYPEDQRKEGRKRPQQGLRTRIASALTSPLIGFLLVVMFLQQVVFMGFEQILPLFTLSRLGMGGIGNAMLFVFVGVILVIFQGKYIGPLSRRFGEANLIFTGLLLVGGGLLLMAMTPQLPVVGYEQQAMIESMRATGGESQEIAVPLPPDQQTGWLGLVWLLVTVTPVSIGGALLQPNINSLITKRTSHFAIGSTLGVSSALVSAANAITPLLSGTLFQFLGVSAPFIAGGMMLLIVLMVAIRKITQDVNSQLLNDLELKPLRD